MARCHHCVAFVHVRQVVAATPLIMTTPLCIVAVGSEGAMGEEAGMPGRGRERESHGKRLSVREGRSRMRQVEWRQEGRRGGSARQET